MKALVTGGAGFIGRWVVKELLGRGAEVVALDDLSNGRIENLDEFLKGGAKGLTFVPGDIKDAELCRRLLRGCGVCYHLGASINVQDSIDRPRETFENDVQGTFNVLEACREHSVRFVFVSTCMVYERAHGTAISETSSVNPASPYAGSKLSGEHLTLSYGKTYGLPVTVLRPFNTYGPYQKTSGEGGVVAVFAKRALKGEKLQIYGDGTQTRDLLFVEDCARFIVESGISEAAIGQLLNAATGRDITINDLARLMADSDDRIEHVPHIHPQSEIARLVGDARKARATLGWEPKVSLEEGVERTRQWIAAAESAG
jgi:UDP-glucose 4-epimerase